MKAQEKPHEREHGSLLAGPEKRLLVWIAERLPGWVSSDHLSALGLGAMLLAGLAFWAAGYNSLFLPLVVVALALNWFGDSLDGTVARVRNQQRPRYGFYVDHVIDVAGTSLLLGGMALSGYMSPVVALALLVAYLMVSAESYLATHARGVFKMSFLRVGPTELRILLAVGTLYLLYKPWVDLGGETLYRLLDIGGVVGTVGLVGAFVMSAARNTRALYLEEPVPAAKNEAAAQRRDEEPEGRPRWRHEAITLEVPVQVSRPNLGRPQLAMAPSPVRSATGMRGLEERSQWLGRRVLDR